MVHARLLLAAASAALVLAACEFLGADQYPSYLQYLAARISLDELAAEAGLSKPYHVENQILIRSSSGVSRLALFVSAYEDQVLFVLDGETLAPLLAIPKSVEFNMSAFLAGAPNGNLLCGGVEFDFDTLEIESTSHSTSGYWSETRSFSDGAYLYIFFPSGSSLYLLQFHPASGINFVGSAPSAFAADSNTYLLSVLQSSDGKVHLLFGRYGSYGTVLSFDSVADVENAFADANMNGLPLDEQAQLAASISFSPLHDNGGWLTADGAIARSHEKSSYLSRYRYGSSSYSDRLTVDDTEGTRFILFSGDGSRWIRFSESDGFLYLMRTWWK